MADVQPIKVVYVVGYGRSGTTVLNIALSQHEAIAGSGEISELSRHVWQENEYCSCGKQIRACQFWSEIVNEWIAGQAPSFLEDYHKLQRKLEGLVGLAKLRLGLVPNNQLTAYANHTKRLFDLIISHSGRQIVLDSSKLPGRAMALSMIPGVDLRLIHMVRDGRGVAWSLQKSYARDPKLGIQRDLKPKPTIRTAARWSMINLAAEYVAARLVPAKSMRMRYEDFAVNPELALQQVGAFLGLDLTTTGSAIRAGEKMLPGHQLAGNMLRMAPSISIKIDESWRTGLPERQQASFRMYFGWLLKRYGYQ